MGRKETPAPDREATRNRIIETAESLFRGVGYAKTTVADIAGALGMSPANVYRYFPSKLAVNEAICELVLQRIEARCQDALAVPGPASRRLSGFLREYHRAVVDNVLKEQRLHDMVTVAMAAHWASMRQHSLRMQEGLRLLLEEGMASGEFRSLDAASVARSLHEAVAGYVYPAFVEHMMEEAGRPGHENDMEEGLMALLDLLLHALRAAK